MEFIFHNSCYATVADCIQTRCNYNVTAYRILSYQLVFLKISKSCREYSCHLHPDDERWHWQLDFGLLSDRRFLIISSNNLVKSFNKYKMVMATGSHL
jgi:hypothetical protein